MKGKLKVVVIIIIAAVTASGIGLALKIKNLSSNLKTSTNITSNLSAQIEKSQRENEGYRKKLEEAQILTESQAVKILSLGKDRQELTARIYNLENKASELEKELAPIKVVRKQLSEKERELKQARQASEAFSSKIPKLERDNLQLHSNLEKTKNQLDTIVERTEKRLSERSVKEIQKAEADLTTAKNYNKLVEKERDDYLTKSAQLKENLNKALNELSEANKKNKRLQDEVADMHYNLGVILTEQNKFSPAIAEFKKVLELKPNDKESHYNLAIIYDEHLKDNQKALEHYRAYLKIAPEGNDSQKVRKWVIDKESELKVKD